TPTSVADATNHTNSDHGFQTISQTSSGKATAAVASLVRSTQTFALGLFPGTAESPLAALKMRDGVQELALPEIRPERVGHVDLGVSDLPQQEIADAHLPARPDEQIGIGDPRRSEMGRDELLIDVL